MMNIAQCTLDLEQIFRLNCSDPVKQERLFLVISGFVYFIMGLNHLYIKVYFSLHHNKYSIASIYRANLELFGKMGYVIRLFPLRNEVFLMITMK